MELIETDYSLDFYKSKLASKELLSFINYTWVKKSEPFIVGRHTLSICTALDDAIDKLHKGISSYLQIRVPFGHGKSDIVSKYLPPYFFGHFPDDEILIATYNQSLSLKFSTFSRDLIATDQYKKVFPNIQLKKDDKSKAEWCIANHTGELHAVGVGGGKTGKRSKLLVIDDPIKDREEAESIVIREKRWEGITNDLLTRLPPTHIVVLMGTPWHVDDPHGRLEKKMKEDKKFFPFQSLTFPYKNDKGEYLFLERFSKEWYESQEASLGSYGTAALLACNPQPRGGNMFKVDRIKIIEDKEVPPGLTWARAWDLASTEKDLLKSDPDYTAGALMAIKMIQPKTPDLPVIPCIYLKSIVRMRENAPIRNERIKQTAMADGPSARVGTESVAGYKDTFQLLYEVLRGQRVVEKIIPAGDKMVRAAPIEPIVEAGNFYIVRGDWNNDFLSEMASFPNCAHDDQVDAVTGGYQMLKGYAMFSIPDSIEFKKV